MKKVQSNSLSFALFSSLRTTADDEHSTATQMKLAVRRHFVEERN